MAPAKSTHCQWCSAVNCKNSRHKRPDLKFYRFPKDPKTCKLWIANCGRVDLELKSSDALFRSNVLCSEHFESKCFQMSGRLVRCSVPTVFNIGYPLTDVRLKRQVASIGRKEIYQEAEDAVDDGIGDDQNLSTGESHGVMGKTLKKESTDHLSFNEESCASGSAMETWNHVHGNAAPKIDPEISSENQRYGKPEDALYNVEVKEELEDMLMLTEQGPDITNCLCIQCHAEFPNLSLLDEHVKMNHKREPSEYEHSVEDAKVTEEERTGTKNEVASETKPTKGMAKNYGMQQLNGKKKVSLVSDNQQHTASCNGPGPVSQNASQGQEDSQATTDHAVTKFRRKNSHCQWCSAVNCNNSRKKRPDLSFYRFPKEPEKSKLWVVNCRRADLEKKSADALYMSNVLCSEHFEPTCFKLSGRLVKGAVPTIFDINLPKRLASKRKKVELYTETKKLLSRSPEELPASGSVKFIRNGLQSAHSSPSSVDQSEESLDSGSETRNLTAPESCEVVEENLKRNATDQPNVDGENYESGSCMETLHYSEGNIRHSADVDTSVAANLNKEPEVAFPNVTVKEELEDTLESLEQEPNIDEHVRTNHKKEHLEHEPSGVDVKMLMEEGSCIKNEDTLGCDGMSSANITASNDEGLKPIVKEESIQVSDSRKQTESSDQYIYAQCSVSFSLPETHQKLNQGRVFCEAMENDLGPSSILTERNPDSPSVLTETNPGVPSVLTGRNLDCLSILTERNPGFPSVLTDGNDVEVQNSSMDSEPAMDSKDAIDRDSGEKTQESSVSLFEGQNLGKATGEKLFMCDIDDASFSLNDPIQNHEKIHNGRDKLIRVGDKMLSAKRFFTHDERFRCNICKVGFGYRSILQRHMITHSGRKLYKCDICDATCTQLFSLRVHRRRHTGERPYKCHICGMTFAQRSCIYGHVRMHTGEKPYKCDTCGKAFSTSSLLRKHSRTHTGEKPYKCGICGARFTAMSSCQRHTRVHTGEKAFKCKVCMASFAQLSHLQRHKITHGENKPHNSSKKMAPHKRIHTKDKSFKCEVCGAGCPSSFKLQTHCRTHSGHKPYKCDLCDAQFVLMSSCQRHRKIHTMERSYKCKICCAVFSQRLSFYVHKRTHSGERNYKCLHCGASFTRSSQLLKHKRTHAGFKPHDVSENMCPSKVSCRDDEYFKCDVCGASFAHKGSLTVHKRTHTKPYKCDVCSASFPHLAHLLKHKRTHVGDGQHAENVCFRCEICGEGFLYSLLLQRHKKTHKSYMSDLCATDFKEGSHLHEHAKKQTRKKPHVCNVCPASFYSVSGLQTHIRTHTGEKPFKCEVCGAAFARLWSLDVHIRKHTGSKPYKCDICGADYSHLATLNRHKSAHSEKKPHSLNEKMRFKCDICGAGFHYSLDLQRHKRTHRPYKCDVCGTGFEAESHLQEHAKRHTEKPPFACDVCSARFVSLSGLQTHIRIHTGEKPFKCNICEAAFARTWSLDVHKRTHTGEKPYKCDICEASFSQRGHMLTHKQAHDGDKRYRCDICGLSLTRKHSLKVHRQRHTKET